MAELRIHSQEWNAGTARLDLRGALNATTYPLLEEELQRWFDNEVSSFVIQMHDLSTLSVAGGAVLVGLLRSAQDRDGRVTLVQPGPQVVATLDRLGVLPYLNIVHSAKEALGAPGQRP